MKRDPAGLSSIEPVAALTLRQRVVASLRSLIVEGDLAPGQRLTETRLAQALNISRAPLREAIRELVDSGLLVSQPYRGLFVRSIGRDDLKEIYSLRTALEKLAFTENWEKRTPDDFLELRRLNEALVATVDSGTDPVLAIEQELELHSWCYRVSGHRLLMENWERLKPNLQFYFMLHQRAHQRPGPMREAHDIYVRLACADDLDAMLGHLETHMRQGLAKTMSLIEAE